MAASSGCSICPPPLYTPTLAESCSAREREVIYGVSPQPGSGWHGPICQELVGIAGETSPARQPIAAIYGLFNASRFVIGDFFCPTELTRPQLTRGIWGLGAEPRAAFELCERGGALWLGGYDADRLVAPMRYTPARTLAVGGQLAVELAALRLGGLTVALPAALRRSTGLDSGSEQIIVPPAACAELSARIEQAAVASGARPLTLDLFAPSRPYSIYYTQNSPTDDYACFAWGNMTASAIDAAMPQLTLAFPGLDGTGDLTMVTAATRSYLLRAQNGTGLPVYCSMFSPADDQILLGAAALRDHVIDFDKPRQRIGVAPSRGCAG